MKLSSESTAKFWNWCNKHISFLKGFFALLFGVTLLYLTHRVIINLVIFIIGLLLIYYGLVALKLKKITDFIDTMIAKLLH